MFRRLREDGAVLTMIVDGAPLRALAGDSVAAALLAARVVTLRRTPRSASPRGLFCGMGACFDCLVTIDGAPNRQACLAPAVEGMRVETGGARPQLGDFPGLEDLQALEPFEAGPRDRTS